MSPLSFIAKVKTLSHQTPFTLILIEAAMQRWAVGPGQDIAPVHAIPLACLPAEGEGNHLRELVSGAHQKLPCLPDLVLALDPSTQGLRVVHGEGFISLDEPQQLGFWGWFLNTREHKPYPALDHIRPFVWYISAEAVLLLCQDDVLDSSLACSLRSLPKHDPQLNETFGELRSLLHASPSRELFDAICGYDIQDAVRLKYAREASRG